MALNGKFKFGSNDFLPVSVSEWMLAEAEQVQKTAKRPNVGHLIDFKVQI
jgi:hypothetical protein